MAFDFRANQIRTSKIIASGSTGSPGRLLIYPVDAASDLAGGINSSLFDLSGIGGDVFAYFSGSIGGKGTSGVSVFGGDFIASGSIFSFGGLSGSLTKLTDGTSYLVEGTNITIVTQSNGSIIISASGGTSITAPSSSVIYANLANTPTGTTAFVFNDNNNVLAISGSNESLYLGVPASEALPNNISASVGIAHNGSVVFRNKANSTWWRGLTGDSALGLGDNSLVLGNVTWDRLVGAINGSIVYTLSSSNSYISGAIKFPQGLSGSLTTLTDGSSYLQEGTNISIVTQSNGSITISSTGGGSTQFVDSASRLRTTASLAIGGTQFAQQVSPGVTFYVSGNINSLPDNSPGSCALSGGDTWVSGNLGTITSQGGLNFAVFNQGGVYVGTASYNQAGNSNPGVNNMYISGVLKAGAFSPLISAGAASASIITGHAKAIFGEESGNTQRRLIVMTASNVIAVGDANNTVHLSSSLFDVYTAGQRRFRMSNLGAFSIGALTGDDSGLGGTLNMGNNTPIYMQDTGNNFRAILSYDANNIIRIGETAANLGQVKLAGTTVGVYATFSRSYTLAMGDDEVGVVSKKADGTIRGADQPNGSVTNISGANLVIRPGKGSGLAPPGIVLIQGLLSGTTGTTTHTTKDVALFNSYYGMQLVGVASSSLQAASSTYSGSLQYLSDTGQLMLLSGSTWKDISRGVNDRIMVAGALTTFATSSTRAMVGQFEFNPNEYTPPLEIYFRSILSVMTGANVTGSVSIYNLTSGSYVEIGGVGVTTLDVTGSTPTLVTSVNLRNATNFYANQSGIYELRVHTTNILSSSTCGIGEIIIR